MKKLLISILMLSALCAYGAPTNTPAATSVALMIDPSSFEIIGPTNMTLGDFKTANTIGSSTQILFWGEIGGTIADQVDFITLQRVGTLTSGTWNASVIDTNYLALNGNYLTNLNGTEIRSGEVATNWLARNGNYLTNMNGTEIRSGVVATNWLALNGNYLTNLNGTEIRSGTVATNWLAQNGNYLTNMNASSLSSGTVPSGRLSGTYNVTATNAEALGGALAAEFVQRDGSVAMTGDFNAGNNDVTNIRHIVAVTGTGTLSINANAKGAGIFAVLGGTATIGGVISGGAMIRGALAAGTSVTVNGPGSAAFVSLNVSGDAVLISGSGSMVLTDGGATNDNDGALVVGEGNSQGDGTVMAEAGFYEGTTKIVDTLFTNTLNVSGGLLTLAGTSTSGSNTVGLTTNTLDTAGVAISNLLAAIAYTPSAANLTAGTTGSITVTNSSNLNSQPAAFYRNDANITNQLFSWGFVDPVPTNATFNTIYSAVFPRAATITAVKTKTEAGTVTFDLIQQDFTDPFGTFSIMQAGIVAGVVPANITSFASTAITNGALIGVQSVGVNAGTNWWISVEYSVP